MSEVSGAGGPGAPAETELRLALTMESKTCGTHTENDNGHDGVAEFELRLALKMESKKCGVPYVIANGQHGKKCGVRCEMHMDRTGSQNFSLG